MSFHTGTSKRKREKNSTFSEASEMCFAIADKNFCFFSMVSELLHLIIILGFYWCLLFYRRYFYMILYDTTSVAISFNFQFDRKSVSWSNITNATQMLKSSSERSNLVNDWKLRVCECRINTLTVLRAFCSLGFRKEKTHWLCDIQKFQNCGKKSA